MNWEYYFAKKVSQYGEKFDPSDLSPKFIPYFESGQRIEVNLHAEGIKRGYVGVTTGWKPSFLLVARRGCAGSSILLTSEDQIIKVIPGMYR